MPARGYAGVWAMESFDLLTVRDSDEVWPVSKALTDVTAVCAVKAGPVVFQPEATFRMEWSGQVGLADPRASLVVGSPSWGVGRVSVVAPYGTMGWPFSYDEWRVESAGTLSPGPAYLAASANVGKSGALLRGSIGVSIPELLLEYTHVLRTGQLSSHTGEFTVSHAWREHTTVIAPFISVGVLPAPGAPSVRAGIRLTHEAQSPAPVLPPVKLPPPPPKPVQEVKPPKPPKVKRIRIIAHNACGDLRELATMTANERVRPQLEGRGVPRDRIEIVYGECRTDNMLEVEIVEVGE